VQLKPEESDVTPSQESTAMADGLATLAGAAETHGRSAVHYSGTAPVAGMRSGSNGSYYNGYDPTLTTRSVSAPMPPQIDPALMGSTDPSASRFALEYGAPYNPDLQTAIGFGHDQFLTPSLNSGTIFDMNNPELFNGFDIPFWLDDGQYEALLNDSNGNYRLD
jgi:hypothetical protein